LEFYINFLNAFIFLKTISHQGTINASLFYTKFGGLKHNHDEEQKQCPLHNVKSNHKGPTEIFVEKKELWVIIWFQKFLWRSALDGLNFRKPIMFVNAMKPNPPCPCNSNLSSNICLWY